MAFAPDPAFSSGAPGVAESVGEGPIADFGEQADSVALRDSLPGEEARSAASIPDQDASLQIFPAPGKLGFPSME